MREERGIERAALYEYRAAWRTWVYESISKSAAVYRVRFATFTFKDVAVKGSVVSEHDPEWALRMAAGACTRHRLAGVVLVESGKAGGRIHVHGLLWPLSYETAWWELLEAEWKLQHGFTKFVQVTDLLGTVHYMTKAFGPESPVAVLTGGKDDAMEVGTVPKAVQRRVPERPGSSKLL